MVKILFDKDKGIVQTQGSGQVTFNSNIILDNCYLNLTTKLITSNMTIENENIILADASSNVINCYIPYTNTNGRTLYIKKIDNSSNSVIINCLNEKTIDGEVTKTIVDQYDCLQIVCYDGNWFII